LYKNKNIIFIKLISYLIPFIQYYSNMPLVICSSNRVVPFTNNNNNIVEYRYNDNFYNTNGSNISVVHYQPGIHSPKLNSTFRNNYTSTRDFNERAIYLVKRNNRWILAGRVICANRMTNDNNEIVYVLNILNDNRVLATNKRDSLAMLNLRYQGGRGSNNNIMHGVFTANLINN